ncbi:MAG TPA: hypothetical protein VFQ92_14150 [Blastocatellia bacterium]|nr:hypothetical protein [Blastocatellia bacterium]
MSNESVWERLVNFLDKGEGDAEELRSNRDLREELELYMALDYALRGFAEAVKTDLERTQTLKEKRECVEAVKNLLEGFYQKNGFFCCGGVRGCTMCLPVSQIIRKEYKQG